MLCDGRFRVWLDAAFAVAGIVWDTEEELSVNPLRQMVLEELRRRNFADTTIRSYLYGVEHVSRYFRPIRRRCVTCKEGVFPHTKSHHDHLFALGGMQLTQSDGGVSVVFVITR